MQSRNSLLIVIFGAVGLALLSSCATSQGRVVQSESGQLAAIGTAKEEPDARLMAIDRAQQYCEKQKEVTVFPDEEIKGGKKDKEGFSWGRLGNIPYLGKVFKSDTKAQVTMEFRCSDRAKS